MATINVGTALNKKYIPYSTTMLASLCVNNKGHIDAYLFNSELDKDDIDLMEKSLSEYDIHLISIDIDKKQFSDKLPRTEQWSLEAYYRLLMFELLPESVDRLIYLDGDIVVNLPIIDFYMQDFGDAEMIVCDDKNGKNNPESYGDKHREMFEDAYRQGFRYFNSGMLLINVAKMRYMYSFDTYLNAIKEWNYEMEAPDQDILNYLHWQNVRFSDCQKYDLFARIAHNEEMTCDYVSKNVAIIHYAGYKPWEAGSFHFDIEKIWWDYAKSTYFYKVLLETFVADTINDKNVEDFIRNLENNSLEKKQLLQKTMKLIEKAMGNQIDEKDNTDNRKNVSAFDRDDWNGGYHYSEAEKEKWEKILAQNDNIDQLEQFLEAVLTDDTAEQYAIRINNEINEIDTALEKANEVIGLLKRG